MSPLQQISKDLIETYRQSKETAKLQRKAGEAQRFAKLLDEEQRNLEVMKRVECLDPLLSIKDTVKNIESRRKAVN